MVVSRDVILKGVETELDRKHIGSQSHFDKEEIISIMLLLHNELLTKVDGCGQSSAIALQNVSFDDDRFNEKNLVQRRKLPVNHLPLFRQTGLIMFTSSTQKDEVNRLPNDFVFPCMTLCTLVTSWFCRNLSTKTLPLKFLVRAESRAIA
jgi:hypothetical protein